MANDTFATQQECMRSVRKGRAKEEEVVRAQQYWPVGISEDDDDEDDEYDEWTSEEAADTLQILYYN